MIDVHCHLNFKSFKDDYDEVIKRALEKGVTRIINVGTSLESSEWAVRLADQYDELYAIVGVHPHHADKVIRMGHPGVPLSGTIGSGDSIASPDTNRGSLQNDKESWIERLEKIATHPKVLAIGEIGMDFYSYKSNGIVDPRIQEEVFQKQIDLAHKLHLPLQIHNRHAGKKTIEILTKNKDKLFPPVPGMFHCFAATKDVLQQAVSLGFFIGFDGNITYPGLAPGETASLSDLAMWTPLDRIVVETDSPYLSPIPHRGSRNEPSYVIITAEYIAKLKEIEYKEFEKISDKNVRAIFPKLR